MVAAWKVIISAGVMGILVGVLSGLPYLQYLNICCVWIIAGGALSAYLLKKSGKIGLVDGTFAGAFTGVTSLTVSAALNLALLWFHIELPYGTIWQLVGVKPPGLGEPLIVIAFSIVFMTYMFLGIILGACGGAIGTITG